LFFSISGKPGDFGYYISVPTSKLASGMPRADASN
jgi:hypothetical protein